MNDQQKLFLTFHEIQLKLKTNYSPFVQFVKNYFKYLVSEKGNEYKIEVNFEVIDKGAFLSILNNYIEKANLYKLSRTIFAKDDTVVLSEVNYLPGLKLVVQKDSKRLIINAFYEYENSITAKLSKIIFKEKQEHAINIILKYYLILFPLIWYNEVFNKRFLIHASAVVYNNKGLIFPGLGGVGKSTFVMALLNKENSSFISDNLILINQQGVIFSCYEAIALDKYSIDSIGKVFLDLDDLDIAMSHKRKYYYFKHKNILSYPASISAMITFKPESKIVPQDNKTHLSNIIAVNNIAKEVREYEYFASILNLAFKLNSDQIKYNVLTEVLAKLSTFQLYLKPYENLEPWLEKLDKVI